MRIIGEKREMMVLGKEEVPQQGWNPARKSKVCSGFVWVGNEAVWVQMGEC